MKNLAIIGCGAWGSALSIALSENFAKIFLICKDDLESAKINNSYSALKVDLPQNIQTTSNYDVIKKTDAILIATPSYAFSNVLTKLRPLISKQNIAWATKGFSGDELLHNIFNKFFQGIAPCVISGPSFAAEVIEKKPTALVVASNNSNQQKFWMESIKSNFIRTYASNDVVGIEVGGAVKNILAIAAGIISGLGYNTNTLSALISRGLAEMSRFGIALGANEKTFMGLSGLGDLVLTCFDDKSRNRSFGLELTKTGNIENSLRNVGATVEGLNALSVVIKLAKKHQISMPICEAINLVISGELTPEDAINNLMNRDLTNE